ncbi:gluconate 2-dehydrogenase subunit 3 family protein [Lacimicrobium alkaliphilum]|uniref:Gluconate 2-dehydrogenase subunit 3 family protein n=1 Tax=Lacimicrobium alkaliphilum TaxID=1526571 RepID=A0ABQ1RGI5_9ALTE|nr:gluconate 2-dehydrogenase subunit 3 family protein [Lacimicrobium alkaliphilum]GGD69679.1 hypothetical protein GCM10011357_25910 [Lacimicrobium alkaliphilum]
MQRREFITGALAALGAGLAPAQVEHVWARVCQTSHREGYCYQFVPVKTVTFFTHLVEHLIPTRDLTNADLALARFVDGAIEQTRSQREKVQITRCLEHLYQRYNRMAGAPDTTMTQLIGDGLMADDEEIAGPLNTIRQLAMVGFYTSEYVARQLLNFDPVPGHYDPEIKISELDKRTTWSR